MDIYGYIWLMYIGTYTYPRQTRIVKASKIKNRDNFCLASGIDVLDFIETSILYTQLSKMEDKS